MSRTPRPWRVRVGQPLLVDGGPPHGSQFTGRPVVCNVGGTKPSDLANARLIAAAPDLLAALELALFALEDSSNESEGRLSTLATIRAAIAKAEGKS